MPLLTDLGGVKDVEDLGDELWPVGFGLVFLRKHLYVPQLTKVEIPLLLQTLNRELSLSRTGEILYCGAIPCGINNTVFEIESMSYLHHLLV